MSLEVGQKVWIPRPLLNREWPRKGPQWLYHPGESLITARLTEVFERIMKPSCTRIAYTVRVTCGCGHPDCTQEVSMEAAESQVFSSKVDCQAECDRRAQEIR